jgi:hypothetical protein
MYTKTITVRPFVSKFIFARYQQPVWEINKQERIGKVIYSMLDRIPLNYKKSQLNLGASLQIQISEDYSLRKGVYLSDDCLIEFSDFIQMELIEEMAMYEWNVKNRTGLKKYKELYVKHNRAKTKKVSVIQDPNLIQYLEKREIIYDILKLYDITEDDLPFETIRKALQRLKLPLLTAS